ncbi:CD1107 family mobile element protein [Enterococcus faecalis]|uniref:CD1107 family mobile element protein n=1 Tax=Enterococcus faecalis TaxID=1351 RepID=UPI00100EDA5A|nr:DUF4366 domain-containing protein [Enterococcus faecalis]RXV99598.1 cell surface protein [Enterococcus faecalis]
MNISLKNKKIILMIVAFTLLIGGTVGGLKVGAKTALASNEPPEKLETYYELKFEDHTSDDTFRGFYYSGEGSKSGQPLNFKLSLSKSFEEKGGVVIDAYNEILSNGDMDKENQLDDLRYITKKTYPYYRTYNVGTAAFASIVSPRDKDNYYIGDITEKEEERTVQGKKANIMVYTCPVLQLNRNIEKVTVDYEGELKEETKKAIIDRVKEANPNINNIKDIKVEKDKLIIETWNRFHTGVPYLELPLEDLYKRVANASVQTDNKDTKDQENQTETKQPDKGNKEIQTELTKDDISKMEKESKELQEKLDQLNQKMKDKDKLRDEQKGKIKELEAKVEKLKEKLNNGKENKDLSPDMKKEVEKLTEKIRELEKKTIEVGKAPVSSISPNGVVTKGNTPQTSVSDIGKGTTPQNGTEKLTKDGNTDRSNEKEKEVRYPNKLTPKQPSNSTQNMSTDGQNKSINTNKGVASEPSKARGTVTENKDNGNKDYPVHHGDEKDSLSKDVYSADARQFVTFTTKNGKTFHLIINHDEDSENVLLLTEVSEDDLLNMVEKKEAPKEVVKEEPVKKEEKPEKKEESNNLGTYLLLFLVIAGALGAGYYFKVIKKKEEKELENFEEDEDDDFFTEVVDLDETYDVKESELEEADDK